MEIDTKLMCPCCKEPASIYTSIHNPGMYGVMCTSCDIDVGMFSTKHEAIKAWKEMCLRS